MRLNKISLTAYISERTTKFLGKLQEHVYHSRIHDIAQLKSRLMEEWEHFNLIRVSFHPASTVSVSSLFLHCGASTSQDSSRRYGALQRGAT